MADAKASPLVTIIMPAWNAEKFIEASVRSVLSQSYRNLRLVVVNDGSTDATGDILARLAAEDPRLLPMTIPNSGPAGARNRALDALDPETDYVMFQDADDYMQPDAVAYALTGAARGAALVIFGFTIRQPDGSTRNYCEPEQLLTRETMGGSLARLYKANLLNQVWGKLYRADLLRAGGFRFPDYRWGEDRFFVFACLEAAETVCILPDCKYFYVMHEGESLITRYYDRKFRVCLEIDERAEQLCGHFGVTEDGDFRYMFLKSVFSCLTMLFSPSCPLSAAEKRAAAREILENERVRARSRGASGGLPVEALAAVLRSGSVSLTLLAFRLVAFTGEIAPRFFTNLKHRK